jgi:hypothetical protein
MELRNGLEKEECKATAEYYLKANYQKRAGLQASLYRHWVAILAETAGSEVCNQYASIMNALVCTSLP